MHLVSRRPPHRLPVRERLPMASMTVRGRLLERAQAPVAVGERVPARPLVRERVRGRLPVQVAPAATPSVATMGSSSGLCGDEP